jgi:MoxR-like ATPase
VQDKDTCVMQAQAAPVAPKDAPAVAPTVAPRLEAAFYKPPDMLEDVVTAIQAETKHHVFLSGAPGIGKSAMAAAVHARCMKVCASLMWKTSRGLLLPSNLACR